MWESRTVVNPNSKFIRSTVLIPMNNNIKEIPVTISAFSIGIFVTAVNIILGVFFIAFMAMDAMVPIITAMKADKNAIINVVYNALRISSFWNNSLYQSKVKPPHFALDLEELKDNTTKVKIGA